MYNPWEWGGCGGGIWRGGGDVGEGGCGGGGVEWGGGWQPSILYPYAFAISTSREDLREAPGDIR